MLFPAIHNKNLNLYINFGSQNLYLFNISTEKVLSKKRFLKLNKSDEDLLKLKKIC